MTWIMAKELEDAERRIDELEKELRELQFIIKGLVGDLRPVIGDHKSDIIWQKLGSLETEIV